MTTTAPTSSIIIPGSDALAEATPVVPGEVKVYPMAKRPGITVLVVVFDAGAVLAKHIAKGPITLQTLSGVVNVLLEGEERELPGGALMHIDGRIEHELVAPVASRVLLTLFEVSAAESEVPAILRKAQAEPVVAPEHLIPVTDVSAARGGGGGCGCGCAPEEGLPALDVRTIPHEIRHATVFGALQGLGPGSAMVLVAHHNPLPLLAQIEQKFAGAIEVTYLQEGPEEWQLRLARQG